MMSKSGESVSCRHHTAWVRHFRVLGLASAIAAFMRVRAAGGILLPDAQQFHATCPGDPLIPVCAFNDALSLVLVEGFYFRNDFLTRRVAGHSQVDIKIRDDDAPSCRIFLAAWKGLRMGGESPAGPPREAKLAPVVRAPSERLPGCARRGAPSGYAVSDRTNESTSRRVKRTSLPIRTAGRSPLPASL